MTEYKRYAVYLAPDHGSELARFGASWLGWDAATGKNVEHPQVDGLPLPISEITATPRKYGFHGTIKAPFRLIEGATQDDFQSKVANFSARQISFDLPLRVAKLGRFIALIPREPIRELSALAAAAVRELDQFRAPMTEAELAKRRKSGLTEKQDNLLVAWGYPYIFEEFRFHLTLSGPLEEADATAVSEILDPELQPILANPLRVSDLCLFGEDENGRFHILERYPLMG